MSINTKEIIREKVLEAFAAQGSLVMMAETDRIEFVSRLIGNQMGVNSVTVAPDMIEQVLVPIPEGEGELDEEGSKELLAAELDFVNKFGVL